jgi:hypothetical protein
MAIKEPSYSAFNCVSSTSSCLINHLLRVCAAYRLISVGYSRIRQPYMNFLRKLE